jgi:hypothetical protein
MRLRALHSVAWIKRFTPENFLSKNDSSLRARRWQKGGSRPTAVTELIKIGAPKRTFIACATMRRTEAKVRSECTE